MEQRKRSWQTPRSKVELFEQIRREREFGVGTISGVSLKLGVHHQWVREALSSAVPAASKPQAAAFAQAEAAAPFIDRVLSEDQQEAPHGAANLGPDSSRGAWVYGGGAEGAADATLWMLHGQQRNRSRRTSRRTTRDAAAILTGKPRGNPVKLLV